MANLSLHILRAFFVLFAGALSIFWISNDISIAGSATLQFLVFGAVMGVATVVILIDLALPRKNIDTISAVYFGLIVGLFLNYVAGLALDPFLKLMYPAAISNKILLTNEGPLHVTEVPVWASAVKLAVGMILCYGCISVLLQTRQDFRFIIPYVEFSREVKGLRPFILDTSVIIDGRVADVIETRVFETQLIMPRFVLSELQSIADSSDRLKRSRGRRGLDIMNRLRATPDIDLQIYDRELPEFANQPVDLKLVLLAKHLDGKIVTNDYNLNKVARLHGVGVVNLNDLANSLKPVFLPGEHLRVTVVKQGEEIGQGVGYLDDGTMVVIEGGREHVSKHVDINVTSVLQTSAGRMIFGKFERLASVEKASDRTAEKG